MLPGARKLCRYGISAAVIVSMALAGCQSPFAPTYEEPVAAIAPPSMPEFPVRVAKDSPKAPTDLVRSRVVPAAGDSAATKVTAKPTGSFHSLLNRQQQSTQRVGHKQDERIPYNAAEPESTPTIVRTSAIPTDVLPERSGIAEASEIAPPTRIAQLGLGDVLALAGADNWAVLLANERIREAQAQFDAANVLWLPSLNAGIGYSRHDGQIQDTSGGVLDVSRNSLFVGGGAVTSDAPTAAGSGGPARMFIDLSLADAIFLPRFAEDLLSAREWSRHVTFNNTLLEASLAYYEVVRAQQQLALARENLQLTENLLKETKRFEESGKGTKGDVSRVEVQVERRKQDLVLADLALRSASAELARILRINLDVDAGAVALFAQEAQLVPVDLIPADSMLNELTAQALAGRPEMSERYYFAEAARQRVLTEHWRPWIPYLHVGLSTGGFGGGNDGRVRDFDGRVDFDLLAIWQVRNLGFGTRAARNEVASRQRQAEIELFRIRDLIIAEVTQAHAEVTTRKRQIDLARKRVEKALDAHKRSLARIHGFVGIPLEALQDVQAVIAAQRELVDATVSYNQAQLRLLRAIGRTAEQQ